MFYFDRMCDGNHLENGLLCGVLIKTLIGVRIGYTELDIISTGLTSRLVKKQIK